MGRKQMTVVEDRCDRCNSVINQLSLDLPGDNFATDHGGSPISFFVKRDRGDDHEELIKYDMICDRCDAVLKSLAERMRPVKKTRRPKRVNPSPIMRGESKGKTAGDGAADKEGDKAADKKDDKDDKVKNKTAVGKGKQSV